jgi:hypothetical protein
VLIQDPFDNTVLRWSWDGSPAGAGRPESSMISRGGTGLRRQPAISRTWSPSTSAICFKRRVAALFSVDRPPLVVDAIVCRPCSQTNWVNHRARRLVRRNYKRRSRSHPVRSQANPGKLPPLAVLPLLPTFDQSDPRTTLRRQRVCHLQQNA